MAGIQYCSQETPSVHTCLKEPVLRTDRSHCPVLISTWKKLNWSTKHSAGKSQKRRGIKVPIIVNVNLIFLERLANDALCQCQSVDRTHSTIFYPPNFSLKMSLSLLFRVTDCTDYVTTPVTRVEKPEHEFALP